jgi:hypothetical protein
MRIAMRRANRGRVARAFPLAGAWLLSACSVFVSGPPEGWQERRADRVPDCTSSPAAPIADTVGAVAFGVPAAALLIGKCGPGDHGQEVDQTCEGITNLIGVVLLLPTALYGVAAAIGYSRTARCREAIRSYRQAGAGRTQAARMWPSLPSSGRR